MQSVFMALGRLNYLEYVLFTMAEFKGYFLDVFSWKRRLYGWQLKREVFYKYTPS